MLNFLGIIIFKTENTFKTSAFRKRSLTGFGIKFDSFVPHQFKTNLNILGLLDVELGPIYFYRKLTRLFIIRHHIHDTLIKKEFHRYCL